MRRFTEYDGNKLFCHPIVIENTILVVLKSTEQWYLSSLKMMSRKIFKCFIMYSFQYIGHSTEKQCLSMFNRFYPDTPAGMAGEFASLVAQTGVNVSAAQIQGFFMFYKRDPSQALQNVWRFKPQPPR